MGIGSAVGQAVTPQQTTQPTAPQGNAPQPVGGKGIQQAVQPISQAVQSAPTSAPQPVGGKGIQQAIQPEQSNFMAPPPGASDATILKTPSAYTPQVTPMQPGMSPQQLTQNELAAAVANDMATGRQIYRGPQYDAMMKSPEFQAQVQSLMQAPEMPPPQMPPEMQPVIARPPMQQPGPQVLPARPPMQQPGPFDVRQRPGQSASDYFRSQGGLRALLERLRAGRG